MNDLGETMIQDSQVEPTLQVQPIVDDASNFIQFINLSGVLSEALYLAMHPEDTDEELGPRVIQ